VGDAETRVKALVGADTVYHLAACHLGVRQAEEEFERINVGAAADLVRQAATAGVRRFVHCSSVGVYGRIASPPADEESPCHPVLAYERTKLAGEQMVLAAAREVGLETVVLRPAWVYGPGCPRTEKLFRTVGAGTFVVGGPGDSLRHCVYVRDMVEAFLLAARSEQAVGQRIIIGDRGAVKIRELVDRIATLTGGRRPPRVPLAALAAAGALAEWVFRPFGAEPPISRRTLEFFTSNTSFRIDRARRLLGFEPAYDLAAGLAETWECLRAPSGVRAPAS
jgi:nucleoside-diphosphate-sugar epimerase